MLLTRASQEAQPVSGSPATQETRVQSLGRDDPLGVGTGNPLQYSLPENPMDTGAWRATVRGVTKNRTQLRDLSTLAGNLQLSVPSLLKGFPCGLAGKESACNARDLGLFPGLGRFPREGKGYPLQCSGLENSMDCIDHGVTKSDFHFTLLFKASFILLVVLEQL